MEERRQDYINLPELLKANAANEKDNALNANNLKHMKETLDEIKDNFKDFLDIYAEDKREMNKLKWQVKWIIAGILAFFGFLGTMMIVFAKKIAIIMAALLP